MRPAPGMLAYLHRVLQSFRRGHVFLSGEPREPRGKVRPAIRGPTFHAAPRATRTCFPKAPLLAKARPILAHARSVLTQTMSALPRQQRRWLRSENVQSLGTYRPRFDRPPLATVVLRPRHVRWAPCQARYCSYHWPRRQPAGSTQRGSEPGASSNWLHRRRAQQSTTVPREKTHDHCQTSCAHGRGGHCPSAWPNGSFE